MAWYNEAVFYHIYPLGLTGAPKHNDYGEISHRLPALIPWISHIKDLGCNAVLIGPLFESVGHGYETTDYKKTDTRLGDNDDLRAFVAECHKAGLKVIFDAVFNHTGRDFFAFRDIRRNREASPYKDWYLNVNFGGNNQYGDGFSYTNWGGHDLLVKLNQQNPEVRNYICDVIRYWVREFDVDGLRLDAADVMDFGYMQEIRRAANEIKEDFWLMGEVIHGDYTRWQNSSTLHSVTNYTLHKALYSGHNDQNYFEIAHTVKRLSDMGCNSLGLYNFADNHDVERIHTKLRNKDHFLPVHILLYTLPGIPSIYYGSEFAIDGAKQRGSDDSLRPALDLEKCKKQRGEYASLISALGKIRQENAALSYGTYKELLLTTKQYIFERCYGDARVIVAVNNGDESFEAKLNVGSDGTYMGLLSGKKTKTASGTLTVSVPENSGEIWVACDSNARPIKAVVTPKPKAQKSAPEKKTAVEVPIPENKSYEEMTVPQLQAVIIDKMKKNGPVTDYMRRTVEENTHHASLVAWAKSFTR